MAVRPGPPDRDRAVLEISRRGRHLVGEPLFDRGSQLPLAKSRLKLREGGIALCRLDRGGARPIAELGRGDRARDVVAALVAERGVRPTFPKRLTSEASGAIAALASDPGPRRDLVGEPTFTVDPESARDFDDAVSARREGDGFRLWIHIADVAAHVAAGSGLDREAYARGNSTYAPGVVSPMLPGALSNEACSLNPGVERLAVTAEIVLSAAAEVASASFYRSRIRSDARLDYGELDRIFSGAARPPEAVAEPLALARAAAAALAESSQGQALTVSGSEPEFSFTDGGHVASAAVVEQTESHRLIERLMILTNEQVATLLEREGVPALYRVHEPPDPDRVGRLFEQLGALDLPTPPLPDKLSRTEAADLATEASRLVAAEAERRGHGAASWSSLVLRALKPAHYGVQNGGHAGLGIAAYAHFTSPIRRYPDLVVHRALLATLGAGEQPPDRHAVGEAAEHCSQTERDSMRIEREGDDICHAFLLRRELHDRGPDAEFAGEVSGVVGAGSFVRFAGEMADTYEGFLPARRVPGDRYELNETESALVGMRTGRRLGIGDPVEVRVDAVEAPRGRVDLVPAAVGERGAGKGRGGKGGKRKTAGQGHDKGPAKKDGGRGKGGRRKGRR